MARLEVRWTLLLPYLLVGAPLKLQLDPLLMLMEVVPPSDLVGDLPWALAWGPPFDLATAPAVAPALPSEVRRHAWQRS